MNRGFIALGFIVVIFLAAVSISFFFDSQYKNNSVVRKRALYKSALDSLMLEIDSSIKSQPAWKNTIKSTLNKTSVDLEKCVNDGDYDCLAGTYSLSVVDDETHVILDQSTAGSGFDVNFKPCTTFGDNSTSCFLRYELTWQPQCPATGPCRSPLIKVFGKLKIDATVRGALSLNTDNYDRNFQLR